jgi:hypothetical protein
MHHPRNVTTFIIIMPLLNLRLQEIEKGIQCCSRHLIVHGFLIGAQQKWPNERGIFDGVGKVMVSFGIIFEFSNIQHQKTLSCPNDKGYRREKGWNNDIVGCLRNGFGVVAHHV